MTKTWKDSEGVRQLKAEVGGGGGVVGDFYSVFAPAVTPANFEEQYVCNA